MFERPALADQTHEGHVSTENLSIPFDWLFGTTLTLAALFFSVVWWVRGIKGQVDNNQAKIEKILECCAREHDLANSSNRDLQDDIRRQFRADIAQSASDICHGFELFAVEIRAEMKSLTGKIDERNAAIADLAAAINQTDKSVAGLNLELDSLVSQLQDQDLNVHIRRNRQP